MHTACFWRAFYSAVAVSMCTLILTLRCSQNQEPFGDPKASAFIDRSWCSSRTFRAGSIQPLLELSRKEKLLNFISSPALRHQPQQNNSLGVRSKSWGEGSGPWLLAPVFPPHSASRSLARLRCKIISRTVYKMSKQFLSCQLGDLYK